MDRDFYMLQKLYKESYASSDQTNFGETIPQGTSNGQIPANGPGNGQTQPLQSAVPTNGDAIDVQQEHILLDAFREKLIKKIEDLINSAENDEEYHTRTTLLHLRSIVENPFDY